MGVNCKCDVTPVWGMDITPYIEEMDRLTALLMGQVYQQALYERAGAADEVDYYIGHGRSYSLLDLQILKRYWRDDRNGRRWHTNPYAVRVTDPEMYELERKVDWAALLGNSFTEWPNPVFHTPQVPECYVAPYESPSYHYVVEGTGPIPAPPKPSQISKWASTIKVTQEMIDQNPPMSVENIFEMARRAKARRKLRDLNELEWQKVPEWDNPCVVRGEE